MNKTAALLVLGLTVGPTMASAQIETLDYQGNPFSFANYTCTPGSSACTQLAGGLVTTAAVGQSITGELVINGLLPNNGTVDFESGGPNIPMSFDFKVAGASLGPGQTGSFLFTTTNGVITNWDFSVGTGFFGDDGAGSAEVVSGESQTPVAGFPPQGPGDGYIGLVSYAGEAPGTFQTNGSGTIPGAWTVKAARQAPEIHPRSAVSGLTLLLGGIAVLRGRRSKPMINVGN